MFPPFKTFQISLLILQCVSSQRRICAQATRLKIPVWVGVGAKIQKEVLAAAQGGAQQPTLPESSWKVRHQMSAENVWHRYAAALA